MIDHSEQAGDKPDFKRRRRTLAEDGAATLDRLPPHSIECERGVLGCCLISPNECVPECIQSLKDEGYTAFYDLRHQTVYETLAEMFDKRSAIDLITVQEHLKNRQLLDQIGGIAYLSQLQDEVPSAANLSYYLEHVKEKYLLRQMINTCAGVVGRIYDYKGEANILLDEVEREILAVNRIRGSSHDRPIKELVTDSITVIEQMFNRKGEVSGIPTGFPDLDHMTDGLHGGDMIVIAARPSIGKTSLACNIAEHVVLESRLPVCIFSLEMSAEQLTLRTMCSAARVNLRNIRDGFMSEADFPKLHSAAGRLSGSKLFIDATPGLSIIQLRARARRMHQQHGIKLFIIDYLQLLSSTQRRSNDNRQQEIAEISSGIKSLAKELNVPVIVLSQLNRELEKDKKRKPRMSDLRESGSIEQDADLVGLLYKPNAPDDDEDQVEESDGTPVNLLIAKQRNGPTGDVNLTFLKTFTRFESAAKFSPNDV